MLGLLEERNPLFVYTWDTTGATLAAGETLYSTQVVLENLDENGNPISSSAIDFFIRLVETPLPPEDIIRLPARMCGVEGSPSIEDPSLLGLGNAQQVLHSRYGRTNTVFLHAQNQANIVFHSGLDQIAALMTPAPLLPIIEVEPIIEIEGTVPAREPGDIWFDARQDNGYVEFDTAIAACRQAWQEIAPHVTGITMVSMNQFFGVWFDDDGNERRGRVLGLGGMPSVNNFASQMVAGRAMVIDPAYLRAGTSLPRRANDDDEIVLAHEIGHGLSLPHRATQPGESTNLMTDFFQGGVALVDAQRQQVRNQVFLHVPDRRTNPTPAPIGNVKATTVGLVPSDETFVDLDAVAFGIQPDTNTGVFALSTIGGLPDDGEVVYYVLADLDHDPTTGGNPTALGIPIDTEGIDLVGRVHVEVSGGVRTVTPTVWRFQNGEFQEAVDPSIQADVVRQVLGASCAPEEPDCVADPFAGELITLQMSTAVLGPTASDFRLIGVAHHPATGTTDQADVEMNLDPPVFPSCQVTPSGAVQGASVAVSVDGFPANTGVEVRLLERLIGSTTTGSDGRATLDVSIPEDAPTGHLPVSVMVPGTGIAATCNVFLEAAPEFDSPPTPPVGGTVVAMVGQPLSINVQASDRDPDDTVTLDAIGAPMTLGATFTFTPGNPAIGTFSWTPEAAHVGTHSLTFTARDDLGRSAPPHTVFIEVVADNQPPVANAGPDQLVECVSHDGAVVFLDGTGSFDPDGDPLDFSWTDTGIVFDDPSSPTPSATFPLGITTVSLTVTDPGGLSDTDTVDITVQDTTPPTLGVTGSDTVLWPPNHQYVPIDFSVAASDLCDAAPVVTAVAVSSEPDNARGGGDGNTTGDIRVTTAAGEVLLSSNESPEVAFDPINDQLELRAERAAGGEGRVYTITITATDASGNQTTVITTVEVPRDQGRRP